MWLKSIRPGCLPPFLHRDQRPPGIGLTDSSSKPEPSESVNAPSGSLRNPINTLQSRASQPNGSELTPKRDETNNLAKS